MSVCRFFPHSLATGPRRALVCVREKKREKKREKERERERKKEKERSAAEGYVRAIRYSRLSIGGNAAAFAACCLLLGLVVRDSPPSVHPSVHILPLYVYTDTHSHTYYIRLVAGYNKKRLLPAENFHFHRQKQFSSYTSSLFPPHFMSCFRRVIEAGFFSVIRPYTHLTRTYTTIRHNIHTPVVLPTQECARGEHSIHSAGVLKSP